MAYKTMKHNTLKQEVLIWSFVFCIYPDLKTSSVILGRDNAQVQEAIWCTYHRLGSKLSF